MNGIVKSYVLVQTTCGQYMLLLCYKEKLILQKGTATHCIINITPQDLILTSGQIIANVIKLQQSNTNPILGSKTRGQL